MPKKVLVRLHKYVRLAVNVTSLTLSLVGLSKSVSGGDRELIIPELYRRWAHVQPLAKCLSRQATAAENKDLELPLQASCDWESIQVTLLAIQNIVLAPSTRRSEGLLVRSLLSYSVPRKVMNGVRLMAGQVRSLGLTHSVVTMMET